MKKHDCYFEWMLRKVEMVKQGKGYRTLLTYLHDTEFRYSIPADENRAEDGIDLRYRFALEQGHKMPFAEAPQEAERPCSVLEMMVALAIRCEEHIMHDPAIGVRTSQWFWGMIANLGLNSMADDRFDEAFVDKRLSMFLDRAYEKNGEGGLFTVADCRFDLRKVEIWYQMCWYLDSIL